MRRGKRTGEEISKMAKMIWIRKEKRGDKRSEGITGREEKRKSEERCYPAITFGYLNVL